MAFGINTIGGTYIESVDVERKAETKVLLDSNGYYAGGQVIDDSYTFTVKGKGDLVISAGDSTGDPDLVTGTVVITSVKQMQSNEDFESFEYSGVAYPYASGC